MRTTRRQFLAITGSAVGAAAIAGHAGVIMPAKANESVVIVEWGGPYVDGMKQLAAKWGQLDVVWELHAGGSAAILPKIRAQWPDNLKYDAVTGWDLSFKTMVREDWAETITIDDIPNLADIPPSLIMKGADGAFKSIPRNLSAQHFAFRKDLCPVDVKSVEDLLDPKLKGQICWPDPFYASNTQMIMLALARGGSESNMDPAWDFMKELAKSGNIGRVYKTEADMITSLSTGETSFAHGTASNFVNLGRNLPIGFLTKVDDSPGVKTVLYTEGWAILKGRKTKAIADFINFAISPENNTWWAKHAGAPPTNTRATSPQGLEQLMFSEEELKKYAYFPDWAYISTQLDGWVKRFEQEIVPLL
jgi:putative spermidine/putrescine transport system substrate-binding protein